MGHENTVTASESAIAPFTLTADFYQRPHAAYDELRGRGPAHFVRFPDGGTGWLITDYEVAKAAFLDPGISKALNSAGARAALGGDGAGAQMFGDMMVFYDPPEHTRLRALVNRAFSSRAVRELAPRVTELADALLAELAADATVDLDLLDRYAFPLPMLVICELLGVPSAERDNFRAWSTTLVSNDETPAARGAAVQQFVAYIDQLIRAKSAEPAEDLLSELITASEEGDRLSHRELISMVFLLLVAGFETTVNLISNAVAILLSDKAVRETLDRDPARVPDFVEEVLRYESPASEATFRYTTVPVTLGGVEIPAGQRILVSMAAADRDPSRFADPHTVDLDRADKNHLAFGYGIHRCVGAPLARMEAGIALTRLLAAYPDLEPAAGAEPVWRKSLIVRGLTELPVRLRP
ncbi:cytochrome P450 family protein [Nocardia seriolae]|uniref:Vitamin D(3) 25-hydroxylase n=1 Tax=Nocardia seriolae TaxID=37332 RepID=A0A0B8NDE3_9NOCA|nr:cytochrome P450 [Nocardia seriolae]APA95674.1 Vitamin D(3) 25-hydroxylase [Nocardia seriolae]MTJ66202.1 cytochrome P450 [Nocardia seriolae]MTJ74768.1 cytochrome P450 [Nocardia seriolae]MTJ85884.1 cytochrome P450 [Nocardia seriolae]MTK29878.1 cytochrome P450 [Nocardia seriolae]